jgi:hypothetical protein
MMRLRARNDPWLWPLVVVLVAALAQAGRDGLMALFRGTLIERD